MTPFHIRERLRKLLLLAFEPVRVEEERFDVTFVLPDGRACTVRSEKHYTLVMASQFLDTPIATGCPDGRCGLCAVDVLAGSGSLQAPGNAESQVMDQVLGVERGPDVRLACHARVLGPGIRVGVRKVWRLEDAR